LCARSINNRVIAGTLYFWKWQNPTDNRITPLFYRGSGNKRHVGTVTNSKILNMNVIKFEL